jgi:prefoldin subunit 2
MATKEFDENNADQVLGVYRQMDSECRQVMGKISELNLEKDEHRLVVETLQKLEGERKAYRLVGGVLVERTVGEVLPIVNSNFEGISELLTKLDESMKQKDAERKEFKEKHGIMTQEEREREMKKQQGQ